MRNLLEGLNSRFELAKERIKKVEDIAIPPIYEYVSEEQKKGKGKKEKNEKPQRNLGYLQVTGGAE